MVNPVVVEITYYPEDISKSTIRTNMPPVPELVGPVLEAWIVNHSLSDEGVGEPNIRESYKITVSCDIDKLTFNTESDTNDLSLTCGIISKVLNILSQFIIEPM